MQHEPTAQLPLREIHAAPPPEWWPPAIGWWLLAMVLILLLGMAVIRGYRAWRRARRVRALRSDFAELLQQYRHDQDVGALLAATADFLRRLQVHFVGDPALRTSSGDRWASALLEALETEADDAHRQAANALAVDRFRPQPAPPPLPALQQLVDCWILRSAAGARR